MAAEDVSGKVGLDTTDWKTGVRQLQKDVRVLESGFKAVAAGMDDWKNNADGLTARNQTLSQVITKQQGVVDALTEEYERMRAEAAANGDETEATKAALQDFEIKLNNARAALNKSETELRQNTQKLQEMQAADNEAGEATENLGESATSAGKATKDMGEKAEKAGKATKDLGDKASAADKKHISLKDALKSLGSFAAGAFTTSMKAAAAAIATVATGIGATAAKAFEFATGAGEMADNVLTLSTQVGVSASDLQAWEYAANFMDTDVDTITKSMARMTKTMGEASNGSASAQEKFKALGVSIYDNNGKLKDSQDLFMEAIGALGGIENATERDAIAMELFGKSAQDLNPLIAVGAEGLAALTDEANAMGVVFSDDALAAMGSFDDSMQRMNATATGLKNTIGLVVMPLFQPFVDLATTSMASVSNALKDGLQPEDFESILSTISGALNTALGSVTTMVNNMLPFVTEGITTLVNSIVAYLPGLIELLIPAATGLVQSLLDAIATNVDPIMNMCMTLVSTIGTFILANVPLLIDTAKNILVNLMQYITDNSAEISAGATAIITTLVSGITTLLPDLIPLAVTMLATLATDLVAAIPTLVAQLPTIVTAIYNGIAAVDWIALAADLITGLAGALVSSVTLLAEQIAPFASGLWDTIKNTDWIALAGDCITGLVNALVAGVSGLGELLAPFVSGIWDTLKNTDWIQLGTDLLQGLVNGLNTAVTTLLESITGVFQTIWNAILGVFGIASPSTEAAAAAGFILDGLLEGFNSAVTSVCETVKQIFGKIWDAIKSIFGFGSESEESKEAKQAGTDIMTGMSDGITGSEDKVKTAVTNASKNALKQFRTELGIPENNGASTKGKTYGESVVLGIRDGINTKGVSSTFTSAVSAVKTAIANAFNSAFGISGTGLFGSGTQAASQFKGIGTAVAEGIANGIKDGASKITSAAKTAANNALAAAKRQLGIASPSREAYKQVGTPFVQGIANALTDGTRTLRDSVTNAVGSMTSVTVNPIRLDGSSMQQTVQPIRAQLVLKEKTFGEIVLDMANRGQGNQAANMSRLNMGVSIA